MAFCCASLGLLLAGCGSGSDGAAGPAGPAGLAGESAYQIAVANGFTGTEAEWLTSLAVSAAAVEPESCAVCHKHAGSEHQGLYNQYKDASTLAVTIDNVTNNLNVDSVTYTSTLTFTIKKDGQPYVDATLAGLEQKRYGAVTYDSATRKFTNAFTYGSLTSLGAGQYQVKYATAPALTNYEVYVYVADNKIVGTEGMQLYSDVGSAGVGFGTLAPASPDKYVSTVNVASCEKCHGTPYMKHGYRSAQVAGLPDFAACKICHNDDGNGGHPDWQVLVDNPQRHATIGTTPLTDAEKTKYAYKKSVMNDVHMSHAMEFPYPQSMANCATCHEGKLAQTTSDANFSLTTCKSCHPVDGGTDTADATGKFAVDTRPLALKTLLPHVIPADGICNNCHRAGGIAPVFSSIHTGYNKKIYADSTGTRYANVFTGAIGAVTLSNNVLTINFSVTKNGGAGIALTAADVVPTVLVGLYGYDTKDFLVGPHISHADGKRNLEAVYGTAHPRITSVSAANGNWQVKADLSTWAAQIADGTIKRAEIAFLPTLKNAAGDTLALNAPSKTFNLATGALVASAAPIVKEAGGCNTCHDALGTTFHSGDRGGNIVVCRLCHTPQSGGSHLEMQSRSIDSYVHAIHSFEAFDIKNINFDDAVEADRYNLHVEHVYPNFTILNCESCHTAGTYEVPDQAKSLPGVLSASNVIKGKTRNIGTVPSYVAGPASRACGSCHRAMMIKEDSAGELAAFNQHTKIFGYLVESTTGIWESVVATIMALF